jgi:NAD(P)-dependent dehydrogenase (short-subunit alcohol dehydrogenase family)
MQDKPVALVTGANRGIGFQIAKDLAAHGFTVLVGSRHLEHGRRAAASIEGDARVLQLDVTDQASIDAAAERIRHELARLDVLVDNARIMNAERPGDGLEEQLNAGRLSAVALDEVRTVFDTNVFGVIAVTKPLLREAPAPRIVSMASSGGSLTLSSDPANPRRARFGTVSHDDGHRSRKGSRRHSGPHLAGACRQRRQARRRRNVGLCRLLRWSVGGASSCRFTPEGVTPGSCPVL